MPHRSSSAHNQFVKLDLNNLNALSAFRPHRYDCRRVGVSPIADGMVTNSKRIRRGNNIMHRVRRTVVSSVISIGALAGLMSLGTLPASAQVQQASQALNLTTPTSGGTPHCSGDVCAKWIDMTSSEVKIETWAFRTTFTGHFELIVPSGAHFNSTPNKKWRAGLAGAHFTVGLSSRDYKAIAWEYLGSGKYKNIGSVTFTV